MRHLITSIVVLLTATAWGREPSKKWQGSYHGYFEQYASAEVPPDAADHVLVIGYVKQPGVIAPRDGLTLSRAIEEVGGLADWADHRHVGIWKNSDGRFIIASLRPIQRNAAPDVPLEKGDMVIVTQRWLTGF